VENDGYCHVNMMCGKVGSFCGAGLDVVIANVWVCGQEGNRYDLTCWRDAANERWRACFVVWPENVVIRQFCCRRTKFMVLGLEMCWREVSVGSSCIVWAQRYDCMV
jgi:hypothetical protein